MKEFKIQNLEDLDFKDRNVFMRVDFNVPLDMSGKSPKVLDPYRIEKTLPSIRFILERGGRILLASHLGRPNGEKNDKLSLKPVAEYLCEKHGLEVLFIEEPDSDAPKNLLSYIKNPQILMLENLRFHPGEQGLDKSFAKQLASYTDIYINEGFGISHRNHTSISLLPKEVPVRALGLQFQKEIEKLGVIRNRKVKKPFFVILGGSKVRDKIPLMESLIFQADEFLIGGLMAYTFLKAMGKKVGDTPVEEDLLSKVSYFIKEMKERGKNFLLPIDHIVEVGTHIQECKTEDLPRGAIGRDIGPKTRKLFQDRLFDARSIFWNGPMGLFEKPDFQEGTHAIAKAVAQHKSAYRIVGGGHSALAVREFEQDFDHVSTGGGASLSYLKGDNLPGLESLVTEVGHISEHENESGEDYDDFEDFK